MDGPAPEEDFSSIPIFERLVHKNWKARVNAYEALVKAFQSSASDEDPVFKPYVGNSDLLKKIATDSNVVAQEKGVESLVALVKFAGEAASRTRETVVPALVDKSFGSTRAGTRAHAVELALQYVEVENAGAGVVADILPGLGAKQPKTVAGCITAIREIVRCFGVQVTPPQQIMKALSKMFGHTDKTVRAEGTTLVHTLYQYIGAGIEPALADLKPVQVKELHEAFEALEKDGKGKGTLKPERMTRAHAREAEAAAEAGEEAPEDEEDADTALDDPRAFAEVVDVISKLPPSWQGPLGSSKWKERKEVLDAMAELFAATPRIKDAQELGEVARALALRIQSDANVACVQTAAAAMEHLAKGVMAPFGRFRETIVPPMIERLKERKAAVTDAIGASLDAVFTTTTLPDIIPDLNAGLTHKNPQVKEGTLKFLGRCLSTATTPIQPAQIKPLAETLAVLMEDSFAGARDEAAVCCGTLMKMVGERPLNPIMDGMADVRKVKVKEAFEKATVKSKAGSGAPKPSTAAAPPAAAPKKKPAGKPAAKPAASAVAEDEPAPPPKKVAKPPARLAAKKPAAAGGDSAPASAAPAVKKLPPSAAPKSSKPPPPAPAGALDNFKYKHTPEDAEALAADMIPSNLLAGFADSNWKTRIAALDDMDAWLNDAIEGLDAEVLVRALAKKGWSEKNFQVSAKMFGIFARLAEQCPSFGRSCIALCTGHMSEKLGDLKLKKPAGDGLMAFAEKTSLQFVLNQAYDPLSKQKAPKVLADAIAWIGTALTEFGIAGVSLRSLIDFLKTALSNSNAAVRTSATKTLVTVRLFAGSSIKDLLEDLNPQLLNTINSEFDKVEGTPAPEPTRTSVDVSQMAAAPAGGKGGAAPADALDDLFPRVELDALMKGTTILADAKSDAWKTKKEALEGLQAILDQGSNKRLKSGMGEIGAVLKARVTDSNKAVQSLALDVVARIATGMGKPFEKHARLFVQPVATVLADQKAPIRTAALNTLTAIANACDGVEPMISGIASALEAQNPLQKGNLLHWLVEWFKEHEPTSALDLSPWTNAVVHSLDDRNTEVRKGAQALLPALIIGAGFDHVLHATNSLKPASRTSAVPLINAARPAAAAAPPPPALKAAPKGKAAPAATVSVRQPSPPPSPPPVAAPPKTASRLGGVRRKLPTGSSRPESRAETPVEQSTSSRLAGKGGMGGLKRPGTVARPAAATPPPSSSLPFHGTNLDAKKVRLSRDATRWINEGGATRKDLAELLQSQMEPYASKDLLSRLFSHDHHAVNDHMQGLGMICDLYASASNGDDAAEMVCLANIDLPLKYVSIKIHEPQPSLMSKCLDAVDAIMAFMRHVSYELSDAEALCFLPTLVHKLGDAREQVRSRVQHIMQGLLMLYPYSRIFQILLDHGLKSKVAKTRQGALDEMANIVNKSGMGAMEPNKACPAIASMISDKDATVRKSALSVLSEVYALVGEKVWSYVGPMSPKDKTQLEERLRRVAGPSNHEKAEPPAPTNPTISRLAGGVPRSASPSLARPRIGGIGGIARAASPSNPPSSRLTRPASPARTMRSASPVSGLPRSSSPAPSVSKMPTPTSPTGIGRPKSLLPGPSRFGRPRTNLPSFPKPTMPEEVPPRSSYSREPEPEPELEPEPVQHTRMRTTSIGNGGDEEITITISSILSSDPARSVEALKKIQKILSIGPDAGSSSPQYQDLAEHTEGLIETITLQMAHIFERQDELVLDENFRLAKHLIQTLNNFCDHSYLAESLTVEILTSLLEELTLRLLETDDSQVKKVKDLSRFINMIILRLFATGRRMSIFRALFALLLRIVKPFPSNGTAATAKEARVAELVLKCVWKLARNIPQDLNDEALDPVELFPAIENFLQTVPPNEWRARATNKVPCGDMPLRTIKVIIQHVVAHYGDDVYDLLSTSFDDPSATIVYPYVYRILNSASRAAAAAAEESGGRARSATQGTDSVRSMPRSSSPASSRPVSPPESTSAASQHHGRSSHRTSPSVSSAHGNGNGYLPPVEEPDPDQQLLTIIGHISSETTGALHKEGITELHHFLKAYPHKRPRVDKLLESTGPAFRKYITRALASRAAEDQERDVAVQDTLSKLEANSHRTPEPQSPVRSATPQSPRSPVRPHANTADAHGSQDKLSRLHDIFQYRSSTLSNGSSHGRGTPRTSLG